MTMQSPVPTVALSTLIILQVTMLAALFAGVKPHPPASVTPFAMAPFLAVSLAVASGALIYLRAGHGLWRLFALAAGAMALLSYGPQKYLDPAFPQVWPAVIAAQVAVLALAISALRPVTVTGEAP